MNEAEVFEILWVYVMLQADCTVLRHLILIVEKSGKVEPSSCQPGSVSVVRACAGLLMKGPATSQLGKWWSPGLASAGHWQCLLHCATKGRW